MNTEETIHHYVGELPIPVRWGRPRAGDRISLTFPMSLGALIDVEGIEGMNEHLDSHIEVGAGILTDITFAVDRISTDEGPDDIIWIRAIGLLEGEESYDDDEADETVQ